MINRIAIFSISFGLCLLLPTRNAFAEAALKLNCTPDFTKTVIDGCGYDYKEGQFVTLTGSQAWSKMEISFEGFEKSSPVTIDIYGSLLTEESSRENAEVTWSDDEVVHFSYVELRKHKGGGRTREFWSFTFYRQTRVLYFSLQAFDTFLVTQFNSPPKIRGQIFKSRCSQSS